MCVCTLVCECVRVHVQMHMQHIPTAHSHSCVTHNCMYVSCVLASHAHEVCVCAVYKTPAPITTHTHRTTRSYSTNTNYTTRAQLHIEHTPPEPHAIQRTAPATTPTTPVSIVHTMPTSQHPCHNDTPQRKACKLCVL